MCQNWYELVLDLISEWMPQQFTLFCLEAPLVPVRPRGTKDARSPAAHAAHALVLVLVLGLGLAGGRRVEYTAAAYRVQRGAAHGGRQQPARDEAVGADAALYDGADGIAKREGLRVNQLEPGPLKPRRL